MLLSRSIKGRKKTESSPSPRQALPWPFSVGLAPKALAGKGNFKFHLADPSIEVLLSFRGNIIFLHV